MSSTASRPTAAPPKYATYPVSAAFAKNGPRLTPAQRQWILRIVRSKNYGPYRARLRFALVATKQVPLVVWVASQEQRAPGERASSHIIGDGCNAYFDPQELGVFAAPGDAACAKTPEPVE